MVDPMREPKRQGWNNVPIPHSDDSCDDLLGIYKGPEGCSIDQALVVISHDPRDECSCGVWTVIRTIDCNPTTYEVWHVTGTLLCGYFGTKREAIAAAFNRDVDQSSIEHEHD